MEKSSIALLYCVNLMCLESVWADNPKKLYSHHEIIPSAHYQARTQLADNKSDQEKLLNKINKEPIANKESPGDAEQLWENKDQSVSDLKTTEENLAAARKNIESHRYLESLPYYNKLLEIEPNNVDLLIEVARVDDLVGDHIGAIELLLKAISVGPNREDDVLRPLGWQYLLNNNPEIALSLFNMYLKKHPGDMAARNGINAATKVMHEDNLTKARAYNDTKQYAKALQYYKAQLLLDPQKTDVLIEAAEASDNLGLHEDAIKYLEKVIQIAPQRRDDVLPTLAWQYADTKQQAKAIAILKDYLSRNPDDNDAKKDLNDISGLASGKEINPNTKTSAKETSKSNLTQSQQRSVHEEAIKYLEKINQIAPQNTDKNLPKLAKHYAEINQPQKAIGILKDYLSRNPNDEAAKKQLDIISSNADLALTQQASSQPESKPTTPVATAPIAKSDPTPEPQTATSIPKGTSLVTNDPISKTTPIDPVKKVTSNTASNDSPKASNKDDDDDDDNSGSQTTARRSHPVQLSSIAKARALAAAKQYEPALEIYRKQLYTSNVDLMIEMAKVDDDANDPKEGIELLEYVWEVAPQRRDEIATLLAWQYANDGQNLIALQYFNYYLRSHPDDVDTLNDAGLVSIWGEYYLRATNYYQRALRIEPTNIDSRIGDAKVTYLRGHYKLAEKKYTAILRDNPNNKDVLESWAEMDTNTERLHKGYREYLALHQAYPKNEDYIVGAEQAEYWAGFDEVALRKLRGLHSTEAVELRETIESDLAPAVELDYTNLGDSDGVNTNAGTISVTLHPSLNSPVEITPTYRYVNLHQYGFNIPGNLGFITIKDRIGSMESPMGAMWPYVGVGARNYGSWNTVAWTAGTKWIPADPLTIYINANNEPVENYISIIDKVLYTSITGGFNYFINPALILTVEGTNGGFGDGNIRRGLASKVQYNLFNDENTSFGISDFFYSDSMPQIDRGYYNPQNYYQITGFANVTRTINQWWEVSVGGTAGQFREIPGGLGYITTLETYLQRNLGRVGVLRLSYDFSQSTPYSQYASSYTVKEVSLTYTYNFGNRQIASGPSFNFISNRGGGTGSR